MTLGDVRRQFGREEQVLGFWFEIKPSPLPDWSVDEVMERFYAKAAERARELHPLPQSWYDRIAEWEADGMRILR